MPGSLSKKIAGYVILLFYGTFFLVGGTAAWLCQSSDFKSIIEQEYVDGIMDFAGKYCRINQQEKGIRLYTKLLEGYPNSVEVLRSIAISYRELGSEKEFHKYYTRALHIDMAKYGRQPDIV